MPLPAGTVMLVEFTVAGQRFQALNGGASFAMNPSISFFVHRHEESEARRLFAGLAEGGRPLMPLDAYPWSSCYGWVQDRFGASWQVIVGDHPAGFPTIVPCLLFSDRVHRRAEEAMRFYAGLFDGSHVDRVERYGAGEGPEDSVKHGRFTLAGQPFVAMDSHVSHGITFNEGISLSVLCADQAEVDRFWAGLSAGGEEGPCGWLKDRFGVSWQVVPQALVMLQQRGDDVANGRMFRAMMGMRRLDAAALERAWSGA